jgi:hypothetical protein
MLTPFAKVGDNIKLTPHKAIVRSIITYAFPPWEFTAHTYL